MKHENEVNSKAGTLKRKTTISNLIGEISKSASMLLIAVAGFGMMSFTQDDTSVNSVDTNLNIKKEASVAVTTAIVDAEACCGLAIAQPGDEIKKALYISLPTANRLLNADREAANRFEAEVSSRRLWSMDIVDATKKADAEMNFNFKVSNMAVSANSAGIADAEMVNSFTDELLKTVKFTALHVNGADNEMAHNFIAEQLSIKGFKPSVSQIAGADIEMAKAFEKANLHITMPSQIAVYNADLEVIQTYQMVELKSGQTVATK